MAPCFLVTFFACALVLQAQNQAPNADPDKNDRQVKVKSGKKTATIRVRDIPGPRLDPPSTGKYDPQNLDLGRSSTFAGKQFSTSNAALSKKDTAIEGRAGNSFITKPFAFGKSDAGSDFGKAYKTSTYTESARGSDDYSKKTFATSSSSLAQNKDAVFANKTSSFANQSAVLDGSKKAPFSGTSDLNDKTFSDPEMKHVRRDPYSAGNGLDVERLVDLPNRPLTIKEVRNLINHETIPHLDEKADDDIKALNDPEYEPPAPLQDYRPKPLPPEEKDNSLPSPGMMATPTPPPENTQPLPK